MSFLEEAVKALKSQRSIKILEAGLHVIHDGVKWLLLRTFPLPHSRWFVRVSSL